MHENITILFREGRWNMKTKGRRKRAVSYSLGCLSENMIRYRFQLPDSSSELRRNGSNNRSSRAITRFYLAPSKDLQPGFVISREINSRASPYIFPRRLIMSKVKRNSRKSFIQAEKSRLISKQKYQKVISIIKLSLLKFWNNHLNILLIEIWGTWHLNMNTFSSIPKSRFHASQFPTIPTFSFT